MTEPLAKNGKTASRPYARTEWPIYILSLEGEEERRAPLLSALADMGLSAEVLIGVDGRKGLPERAEEQILRQRLDPAKRPLTDGEYACALSHVNAYRNILDQDVRGAIIFEDDARIDDGFKTFVEARGYALGDMVLLGHRRCWVSRFDNRKISPRLNLHRIAITPHLAHAYSVSSDAARALLEAATPVREPADWPCELSRMNVFAIEPQVAHQRTQDLGHSHLEADRLELLSKYKPIKSQGKWKRLIRKRSRHSWWRSWLMKRMNRRLS